MPNKTTAIIIGIFLVTGAGFIFASTRDNAPREIPLQPEPTVSEAPALQPESQPQIAPPSPQPVPTPQITPPAAPVSQPSPPQEIPKQKSTPSSSSSPTSTVGLEGLWKMDRELTIDNATGDVIKENHFLIYTSFKGSEQCLEVQGTETNLTCTSGYFLFSIDSRGVITDADGFDNYRYQTGGLEAIYVQGAITKQQIFKKVSDQPVP